MDLVIRLEVGDDSKEISQGSDNGVKVKVNVVGSNIRREMLGSISSFLARVLCAHVAGMEEMTVDISNPRSTAHE